MTNEEFQNLVLEKLGGINERLGNLEGQQSETNAIVKSLMHNSEALSAKVDGLAISTASKDFAKRSETMITLMNAKMATKEDLAELRLQIMEELDAVRSELKEDIKSIAEVTGEHEMNIRTLMRKPV